MELDAEKTQTRMPQGSSVTATRLIPGRGYEFETRFTHPYSSTMLFDLLA